MNKESTVKKLAPLGVLLSVLVWTLAGCNQAPPSPPPPAHDHAHDHAHGEHGPHEGELIELGSGKYHAELVHDEAAKLVTIYLLGGDAKSAAPIAEESLVVSAVVDGKPEKFVLAAKPLEGEAEGQSSRFESSEEALATAIDNPASKANLSVTIEGRPYVAPLAHDHSHEHGEK
jgi:hypothetical protein